MVVLIQETSATRRKYSYHECDKGTVFYIIPYLIFSVQYSVHTGSIIYGSIDITIVTKVQFFT